MADENVLKAFELMWGNFPEPVMLVHKNHDILGINKAAEQAGLQTGIKCSSIGRPEAHRGCLAAEALAAQKAAYAKNDNVIAYWIPVTDNPDIYIHFGVGRSIDYDSCRGEK